MKSNKHESVEPKYIRLPRSGQRCQITGLSRSCLNRLVLPTRENAFQPHVRSVVLKSRDESNRGVRMIEVESLLEYLRDLHDWGPLPVGARQVTTMTAKHQWQEEADQDTSLPGESPNEAKAKNGRKKGGKAA